MNNDNYILFSKKLYKLKRDMCKKIQDLVKDELHLKSLTLITSAKFSNYEVPNRNAIIKGLHLAVYHIDDGINENLFKDGIPIVLLRDQNSDLDVYIWCDHCKNLLLNNCISCGIEDENKKKDCLERIIFELDQEDKLLRVIDWINHFYRGQKNIRKEITKEYEERLKSLIR